MWNVLKAFVSEKSCRKPFDLVFASRSSNFLIWLIEPTATIRWKIIHCCHQLLGHWLFNPGKLSRCDFEFVKIVICWTQVFEVSSSTGFHKLYKALNFFVDEFGCFIEQHLYFVLFTAYKAQQINIFIFHWKPSQWRQLYSNRYLFHPRSKWWSKILINVLNVGWVTQQIFKNSLQYR